MMIGSMGICLVFLGDEMGYINDIYIYKIINIYIYNFAIYEDFLGIFVWDL